jgi:hypothetical protein
MLLVAMASTALANDPLPYPGLSRFRVLKSGKAEHDVRGLQQFLTMRGYNTQVIDGALSNIDTAVENHDNIQNYGERISQLTHLYHVTHIL